jgi:L-alanine-DL-glutamate epimerase-like enolase superfamily enzyme
LIRAETDNGLAGMGAALGTPPIVAAIVEHELAAGSVDEDPLFSERIYEKMYNSSRSRPALEQGVMTSKKNGKPVSAKFVPEEPKVCARMRIAGVLLRQ